MASPIHTAVRLTFFVLFICFLQFYNPTLSKAQSEVSINVAASVISSVEYLTIQSMRLTKAETQNDVITVSPLTSPNAGKMIAVGTPNKDIRISFQRARELTRIEGGSTLIFNYRLAGNTVDDQSTSELLDDENRSFKFNENGQFFIWIGGSVDISTALPGNYQGEFTLEIEYI